MGEISALSHETQVLIELEGEKTREEIRRALGQQPARQASFPSRVVSESAMKATFEATILHSLYFERIHDRQEEITNAHEKTFEWIYLDPANDSRTWGNLSLWLAQDSDLYWITGKAGSGKSTLMKYLHDNPKTQELLNEWAGDDPIVIASFYAWNVGDKLQKSQEGLLRSLLHEVIHQYPALATLAFPDLWTTWLETYAAGNRPQRKIEKWRPKALRDAILALINQNSLKVKYCFLIDGLDEYDGDHANIAGLCKDMSSSGSTKLCVSSRPLLVFETAFKGCPGLMLQYLTYDDIKLYIEAKFAESERFREISTEDPQHAQELHMSIVDRASGVFLWVRIAVESLLDGIQNFDRISDLRRRLDLLPSELEALYVHIFKNLDPLYLEQAAKLFQLVGTAITPLTPLQLALADEEDPLIVYEEDLQPLTKAEMVRKCREVEGRLKSRCRGLLEIQTEKSLEILHLQKTPEDHILHAQVDWLHKTVFEYIQKDRIWNGFTNAISEPFHPQVQLLKAFILEIRIAFTPITMSKFLYMIRSAFSYARMAEYGLGHAQVALMEELYGALEQASQNFSDENDFWPRRLLGSGCWDTQKAMQDHQATFLMVCISHGLYHHVKHTLDENRSLIQRDLGQSLLRSAIIANEVNHQTWVRDVKLVELLLQKGSSPNQKDDLFTPWQSTLRCIHQDVRQSLRFARWSLSGPEQEIAETWCEITRLMLAHGADPYAVYESSSRGGVPVSVDAETVVRETFVYWVPEHGVALLAILRKKRSSARRMFSRRLSSLFSR